MTSTICNDLDKEKAEKAVRALLRHEEKRGREEKTEKLSLLGPRAKAVLLQLQLKRPVKKPVLRPIRVKIPHSLFDAEGEDHSICLFCRSTDKGAIDNALEERPIEGLNDVISLDQLKKNYKAFREKKELFSKHSHFVCDNRIFSHVVNLLGETFSRRNNHPIPIDISNLNKMESVVNKAIHNSTYLHLSGQNITIRMGLTSMEPSAVVANVQAGACEAVDKIGCGWGGILSIYIKSSDSPALPIHNSYANEMGEFVDEKMGKSKSKQQKSDVESHKSEPATETPRKKKKNASTVETPKQEKKSSVVETPKSAAKKPSPRATRSVTKKRALAAAEKNDVDVVAKKTRSKPKKLS